MSTHTPSWQSTAEEFEHEAKRDAYGRLRVLLGLVQWTTENDIRDATLQPFLDLLSREARRAKAI